MFKLKGKKKKRRGWKTGREFDMWWRGGRKKWAAKRQRERERGICCPCVVKSPSPPSLGLGTGSISFGLLRKTLEEAPQELWRGQREGGGFFQELRVTRSPSAPRRDQRWAERVWSHTVSLFARKRTHTALVSMRTKAGTNSYMSHRHTQFDSVTFPPA